MKCLNQSFLLVLIISTTACLPGSYDPLAGLLKLSKQQQLVVEPNPLKFIDQKATFTLSAKIPIKMMRKHTTYTIEVFYVIGNVRKFVAGKYPNNEVKVGSITFIGALFRRNKYSPHISKSMSFTCKNKPSKGYLIAYGVVSKREKAKKFGPFLVISKQKPITGVLD